MSNKDIHDVKGVSYAKVPISDINTSNGIQTILVEHIKSPLMGIKYNSLEKNPSIVNQSISSSDSENELYNKKTLKEWVILQLENMGDDSTEITVEAVDGFVKFFNDYIVSVLSNYNDNGSARNMTLAVQKKILENPANGAFNPSYYADIINVALPTNTIRHHLKNRTIPDDVIESATWGLGPYFFYVMDVSLRNAKNKETNKRKFTLSDIQRTLKELS